MKITLSTELEHIKEIKDFVENKENFNTNTKFFKVDDINIYLGDWVRHDCQTEPFERTEFKQISVLFKIIPKTFNISNHLEQIKIDLKHNGKDIIFLIDDFHTVLQTEKDKIDFKMDNVEMFLQDIHKKFLGE